MKLKYRCVESKMCYVIQKFSHLSNEASVDFYKTRARTMPSRVFKCCLESLFAILATPDNEVVVTRGKKTP